MKNSFMQTDLKISNRRLAYDFLAKSKTVSKIELSRVFGMSSATAMKIINYFVSSNICFDEGLDQSFTGVGRKPMVLRFNPDFAQTVAVFVEGNYISIAILNMAGEIKLIKEFKTIDVWDFFRNRLNSTITSLVKESCAANLIGIGIAIAAIIDLDTNEIIEAPLLGANKEFSFPKFVTEMKEAFGLPVIVHNDVNVLAYGEYMSNYSDVAENMIYITVGTGVGAGIILNSRIVLGDSNAAGEIGYMIMGEDEDNSHENGGWLENKININGIRKILGNDLESGISAQQKTIIIDYVSDQLSKCIHNITAVMDIDLIVLGGIIVEDLGQQLIDELKEKYIRHQYQKCSINICKTYKPGIVGLGHLVAQSMLDKILTE